MAGTAGFTVRRAYRGNPDTLVSGNASRLDTEPVQPYRRGKALADRYVIAILGAALFFGLGHLPATMAATPFSTTVLARAILLNGIYGVLFGYLYWKRGLESSMTAHFTSDVLVHVILPFLLS